MKRLFGLVALLMVGGLIGCLPLSSTGEKSEGAPAGASVEDGTAETVRTNATLADCDCTGLIPPEMRTKSYPTVKTSSMGKSGCRYEALRKAVGQPARLTVKVYREALRSDYIRTMRALKTELPKGIESTREDLSPAGIVFTISGEHETYAKKADVMFYEGERLVVLLEQGLSTAQVSEKKWSQLDEGVHQAMHGLITRACKAP